MSIDLVILGLIVLFSFMIGASIGFGSSVLTVTLAAVFLDIRLVVPAVVPLNLLLMAYLLFRYRDRIERRILLRNILPLTLCGLPVGLAAFHYLEVEHLKWVFGSFIILLSTFELIHLSHAKNDAVARPLSEGWTWFFLLTGGFVQGLWVSGGPMIAYWASRNLASKGSFRATLAALWLILNALMLAGHLTMGIADRHILKMDLYLLPFLAVAIMLGEILHGRLSERKFKTAVYAILVIAGLTLILR